jgi:hypothetical protein
VVELGSFVALTFGQQRWIKPLGLGHGEVLTGTKPDCHRAGQEQRAPAGLTARAPLDAYAAGPADGRSPGDQTISMNAAAAAARDP